MKRAVAIFYSFSKSLLLRNFECDWLIELSNLASELVENRSFSVKPITILHRKKDGDWYIYPQFLAHENLNNVHKKVIKPLQTSSNLRYTMSSVHGQIL